MCELKWEKEAFIRRFHRFTQIRVGLFRVCENLRDPRMGFPVFPGVRRNAGNSGIAIGSQASSY
jgi:hypothetical protein